jgi:hypothetical protein
VIGAVARRAVTMAVQPLLARQESVQRGEQVGIGARPDLDDDDARGGVRDEDRQETVTAGRRRRCERGAVAGQVDQAAVVAGPDRQLAGVYGKMLRKASRRRPRPPPAGADS